MPPLALAPPEPGTRGSSGRAPTLGGSGRPGTSAAEAGPLGPRPASHRLGCSSQPPPCLQRTVALPSHCRHAAVTLPSHYPVSKGRSPTLLPFDSRRLLLSGRRTCCSPPTAAPSSRTSGCRTWPQRASRTTRSRGTRPSSARPFTWRPRPFRAAREAPRHGQSTPACPPRQHGAPAPARPSSPPVPPQRAPGGSGVARHSPG